MHLSQAHGYTLDTGYNTRTDRKRGYAKLYTNHVLELIVDVKCKIIIGSKLLVDTINTPTDLYDQNETCLCVSYLLGSPMYNQSKYTLRKYHLGA